ncbi:exonuclease SbcCD subunit D [Alkalihalobacterium bogoriense]|uniref:exonuclease SbcCD subunit D n=1 Tax=Alkalihalobacterium bogoriense TaxID=246272 RepID=UPI000479540A|nr:exonuclease SbcCD subunit D [Alkalihalobacterium bogoriense]
MRILHTADWHLGRTLEGRSRLEEQAQFLDELHEIVLREQVDVVLMAGDVFDTVNPPAAAEQLFYESMARISNKGKCPIVVIAGNHDNPDRLTASSPLALEQNITIIGYPLSTIVKVPIIRTKEELRVAALAYPSESRLNEVLADSVDEVLLRDEYDKRVRYLLSKMAEQFSKEAVNVAMSHIYVAGSDSTESERPIEVGGAYTVRSTSLPELAQYVALGHLHRPQDVKKAPTIARYSGSPIAFSFSEAGYAKSVSIVDVEPGKPATVSEIYLSSGKPLVRWKAENGIAEVYEWLDEGKDTNAWVDLEVHVDHSLSIEEIHRLRKLHSGFIHIRPVYKEMDKQVKVASSNVPLDEMFTRFYKKQTGGAVPEQDVIRLFLELVNEQVEEDVK